MKCPHCSGVGTIPRMDPGQPVPGVLPIAGAHHSVFPKLCDHCSGTGEVKAAPPATEGQAPTPAVWP